MSAESQEDLWISPRLTITAGEFAWSFARGSGPGGQNVNKVNSKAILRWNPTESPSLPSDVRDRFCRRYASRLTEMGELIVSSEESRDQPKNISRCREKLREMVLAVAVPPRPRKPTKPSKGSQRRRLASKQRNAEKKRGRQQPGEE